MAGSALGNKYTAHRQGQQGGQVTGAATGNAGGYGGGQGGGYGGGGGGQGYQEIFLDEWNTAPVFALWLQDAPAGIDRPIRRQARKRLHNDYLKVGVDLGKEATAASFL
jgi:hypothetical protein